MGRCVGIGVRCFENWRQKECEIAEGHLIPDHAHVLISIPPRYSVWAVRGFIQDKSVIHIARVYAGKRRNIVGQHFWVRGYLTVGKDEATVRRCIQEREKKDQRLDQLETFRGAEPV